MFIQVFTQSFGLVNVNNGSDTYNGLTVEQIKQRLQGWHEVDKKQYLENVAAVIDRQMSGFNQNEIESLLNSNFNISKQYI